jgi:methionyl aminopeptidase
MSRIKNEKEIKILREGGKHLAQILAKVAKHVKAGVTSQELDTIARDLIIKKGDIPSFLHYTPEGIRRPYPAALCVSINEEVVHGIPGNRKIQDGDVVSIDLGLNHKGMFTDHAITLIVGKETKEKKNLLTGTQKALMAGIKAAKPKATTGDIGSAIEKVLKAHGLGVVRILSGHGVGHAVHEEPYVPNYGTPGTGTSLAPGMVIAIEPMATLGSGRVRVLADEYTYISSDQKLAAHFEHTVLITEKGSEVLTSSK